MIYDERMVAPMRQELTRLGVRVVAPVVDEDRQLLIFGIRRLAV